MAPMIRKLICRGIFVGFCVAPLCGSLSYAAWQHFSLSRVQRGDWLAARLGVDAEIEGLRPSQPGLTVADRIRLADPESGRLLVLCEQIRLRSGPQALVVSIEDVHIPQRQTMELWKLLCERVLRQSSMLRRRMVIVAHRVAIRHADGELELAGWRMECSAAQGERRADIEFRANHASLQVRSTRIAIVRDTQHDVPVTRVEVHAPEADVDSCLLAGPSSWLSQLGEHVRFRGMVFIDVTSQGWRGEVTGSVSGIELQRLSQDRLPHGLTGEASLDIRHAIFDSSRLQSLSAIARAGPGKISWGLLASLRRLGLSMPSARLRDFSADTMQDYEQLALMVDLTSQGVVVRGVCGPPRDGTAILSGSGTLLTDQGRNERKSSFEIIATLLDDDRADVLLTPTGERLWRALPLSAAR